MITGARQPPLAHLSIRVPWNDVGWGGHVCRRPKGNNSCLILRRVAEERNDDSEEANAGKSWGDLGQMLPACAAERGAFMSDYGIVRLTERELTDQKRSKLSRSELTPFSERGGAVLLEDIAAIEVAVLVEVIVDRGMGGGEFLQGLDVPKLRHRSFSSWERLV